MAGRQSDRIAFIGRDNAAALRLFFLQHIAEIFQQGVRHTAEERNMMSLQFRTEHFRVQHIYSFSLNRRIRSLLVMQNGSASSDLPCSRIIRAARSIAGYALRIR